MKSPKQLLQERSDIWNLSLKNLYYSGMVDYQTLYENWDWLKDPNGDHLPDRDEEWHTAMERVKAEYNKYF